MRVKEHRLSYLIHFSKQDASIPGWAAVRQVSGYVMVCVVSWKGWLSMWELHNTVAGSLTSPEYK